MNKNCIFCRIISGKAPATIYFQDDLLIAFQDIHPAAPVHILVVPRAHIPSINDLDEENAYLIGHMFITAGRLAKENGIADTGYRLIINNGPDAKQAVFHLHLHLLGGRPMRYPMG